MFPRWARNSVTRSAWTSWSFRNGSELKGRCGYEPLDLASFETGLDPLALFSRERPVVDGDIPTDHGETGTEQLRERAGVHEDEGRPTFVEGIVDRGEAGGRLGGDVEVPGGLEVFVDRTRPLDPIFVSFLQVRGEDFQRPVSLEEGGDGLRLADGGRESDPLEAATGDFAQTLEGNCQLSSSTVLCELMNFVHDDKSNVLQMPLHHFPG